MTTTSRRKRRRENKRLLVHNNVCKKKKTAPLGASQWRKKKLWGRKRQKENKKEKGGKKRLWICKNIECCEKVRRTGSTVKKKWSFYGRIKTERKHWWCRSCQSFTSLPPPTLPFFLSLFGYCPGLTEQLPLLVCVFRSTWLVLCVIVLLYTSAQSFNKALRWKKKATKYHRNINKKKDSTCQLKWEVTSI